jgi:hypothetical protein
MAKPTFYPTTLTEDLAVNSREETRYQFDTIVADLTAPVADSNPRVSDAKLRTFVTVRVNMPHVAKYGKPSIMELTYGCSFVVRVGDRVLCPPTRLNPKWTTGVVKDLAANGYRGPVKYIAPLGAKKKG